MHVHRYSTLTKADLDLYARENACPHYPSSNLRRGQGGRRNITKDAKVRALLEAGIPPPRAHRALPGVSFRSDCPFIALKPRAPFREINGNISFQSPNQLLLHPLAPNLRVSGREVLRLVSGNLQSQDGGGNGPDWLTLKDLHFRFYREIKVVVTDHSSTSWCPQTWRTLSTGDFVRPRGTHCNRATGVITCLCARVLAVVTISGFEASNMGAPPAWLYHTTAQEHSLRALKQSFSASCADLGISPREIDAITHPDLVAELGEISRLERACLVLVEYLAPSPVAVGRDETYRPMCSTLPYNHALWEWDALVGGGRRHMLRDTTCITRVSDISGAPPGLLQKESTRVIGLHALHNVNTKLALGADPDIAGGWIETITIAAGRNSTTPSEHQEEDENESQSSDDSDSGIA